MMRRLLPLALVLTPAVFVYACSSSSSDPGTTNTNPEGGSQADTFVPGTDSSTPTDSSTNPDTSVPPSASPIDGIAAPTPVASLNGVVVVGPLWHTDGLYYSELTPGGNLIKLTPPSATTIIRGPVGGATDETLGTTFDEKTMTFVSCQVQAGAGAHGGQIIRTTAAGQGTPIALIADGGAPPAFDSPKNVAARHSDGTLYITDPGYQTDPPSLVVDNHIWRIKPTTGEVIDTIADGRPNGIAFTPDQKAIYVSFTGDGVTTGGAAPAKVMKYPVNTDGSLGVPAVFGSFAVDALVDGVIVDVNGNVYVANKTGIDVFKTDGTKWGHITVPKPVNGLAFGGADKKTIYLTTDPNGLMQVTVKVAGLVD